MLYVQMKSKYQKKFNHINLAWEKKKERERESCKAQYSVHGVIFLNIKKN